jgi:hypothetical protein
MDKLVMPEGKHVGKTLQDIMESDPEYLQFIAGHNLSYIQQLKYKDFFDRIQDIRKVVREHIPQAKPATRSAQVVKYPGGWRGW